MELPGVAKRMLARCTKFISTRWGGRPSEEDDAVHGQGVDAGAVSTTALDLDKLADQLAAQDDDLQQLEGQNVVALIGRTGTGKTTLIQALAGKKLKKTRHGSGRRKRGVYDAKDPITGFEIGHEQSSQTKHAKPWKRVPPKLRGQGEEGEPVFYLDTPGYEDTTGTQVDAATSVSLQKAARLSGKFRVCVLISCVSFLESRGGAIRDVAKLISRIMKFQRHRRAFTFLFTHTDALTETKGLGPVELKLKIRGLLEATSQGTEKHSEEWEILQWMIECLDKDHPYVGVFHPQYSDTTDLIGTIERFTPEKDGTHPALGLTEGAGAQPGKVVRCGLTPKAGSQISLKLQEQIEYLKCALHENDLNKMQRISKTLSVLHSHVDLKDVVKTFAKAQRLVQTQRDMLLSEITSLRGAGVGAAIGFGPQNAQELLDLAERLDELAQLEIGDPAFQWSGKDIVEDIHEQLGMMLKDLRTSLESEDPPRSTEWVGLLENILAWAGAGSRFGELQHQSFEIAGAYLRRAAASAEEAAEPVVSVVWLARLKEEQDRLVRIGLSAAKGLDAALRKAEKRLEDCIQEDSSIASSALKEISQNARTGVAEWRVQYHESATRLEAAWDKLVATNAASENLRVQAETARHGLIDHLSDLVGSLKTAAVDAIEQEDLGQPLEDAVALLASLNSPNFLTARQREECCVEAHHKECVDRSDSAVRRLFEDARKLFAMAYTERSFGALRTHVPRISVLSETGWLDAYLPGERRFAEECIVEVQGHYRRHLKDLTRDFWDNLSACFQRPHQCEESLKRLKDIWPDVESMQALDATVAGAAKRQERLAGLVKQRVSEFCQQCRHAWDVSAGSHKGGKLPAEVLEEAIAVSEALSFVETTGGELAKLAKEGNELLQTWQEEVRELMVAPKRWEEKGRLLDAVASWEDNRLSRVLATLPEQPEVLRNGVRKDVQKEAESIHQLFQADEPDLAVVEAALEEFQVAAVVDWHIDYEVKSQMKILSRTLEFRRADISEALSEKIQAFEFKGLSDRLKVLEDAQDPVKQAEFSRLIGLVEKRVEAELSIGSLVDPQQVMAALRAVDAIDPELKGLLSRHRSLDISERSKAVKGRAKQHFKKLLQQLNKALDVGDVNAEWDFRLIAKCGRTIRKYLAVFQEVFSTNVQVDATNAISRASKIPKDVSALVSIACEYLSGARREFANPDLDRLRKMMQSLGKIVSDRDALDRDADDEGSAFADRLQHDRQATGGALTWQKCADSYDSARQLLTERFQKLHGEVSRVVRETELDAVAVVVYERMHKVCESGMKDHLSGLSFDIEGELDAARMRQKRWEQPLDSAGAIDRWAAMLKKLDDKATIVKLPLWHDVDREKEYTRRRKQMLEHVQAIFDETQRALERHDYRAASPCASLAVHARGSLCSHLDDLTMKHLDSLEEKVTRQLRSLSNDIGSALKHRDASKVSKFDSDFKRFHELRQHFVGLWPGLAEDCPRIYKRIGGPIRESVEKAEKHLHEFEFADAADGIAYARTFGPFITGARAIHHREVSRAAKDPSMEELDGLRELEALNEELFSGSADAALGEHYALLDLHPGASQRDVQRAYNKSKANACQALDKELQHAKDELSVAQARQRYQAALEMPFSPAIAKVPQRLRAEMQACLKNDDYGRCLQLLTAVDDLPRLERLTSASLDCKQVRSDLREMVKRRIQELCNKARDHWEKRELPDLQDVIFNLDTSRQKLSAHSDICSGQEGRDVVQDVKADVEHLAQKALLYLSEGWEKADASMKDFALVLISLGKIMAGLSHVKQFARTQIHRVLEECQEKPWGYHYLFMLGILLERGTLGELDDDDLVKNEDQQIAKVIVKEFRHFKDVHTVVFNEQTAVTQGDPKETLQGVSATRVADGKPPCEVIVDKDALQKLFDGCEAQYDNHFHKWRAGELTLDALRLSVVRQAVALYPCSVGKWGQDLREAVPSLLAGICAYLTISKSGESYLRLLDLDDTVSADESEGSSFVSGNADRMLLKPHCIQIFAILRLLGCDVPRDEVLSNQLLQVRTGEGKSLILGVCSVLLGLLGFKVRCVCYSEYLSQRDYRDFREMFEDFGVADRVVYSTVADFSEDSIDAKGNLREMTLDLLKSGGSPNVDNSGAAKPSMPEGTAAPSGSVGCIDSSVLPPLADRAQEILLLDEVDVFFGKDFYGKTHNLVAEHAATEVKQLFREVWAGRLAVQNSTALLQRMRSSEAYKQLLDRHEQFSFLIEGELVAMCQDVYSFNNPPCHYDRTRNMIGYQVMDSVSFDVVYGYRTAFAYMHEAEKRVLRDPDAALDRALKLRVPCGQFSYASNIHPSCILGVSGTVNVLDECEWRVMNRYGIDLYACMPSVYGETSFRFLDQHGGDPITLVTTQDDLFRVVTEQVKQKVKCGRAAIVLFKDPSVLNEYLSSPHYKKVANKSVLTESQSYEEKEYAIKRAATVGQATFTTAVFGRGTDFFSNDPQLQAAGGVHVVQAFFSPEKSEQVQIQGRTARQGQPGTYSLVLLEEELEADLGINPGCLKKKCQADQYEQLDQARSVGHQADFERKEEALANAEELDELSHQYLDALLRSDSSAAITYLGQLYSRRRIEGFKKSRTIILIDATGSMESIWDEARECVKEMLRRIEEIGGDNLDLRIAAYRDYSDGDDLLQYSSWSNNPVELQSFVDGITCFGGPGLSRNDKDGREAVEHAMSFARTDHESEPVTRIVLIGDAPPHSESEGDSVACHAWTMKTDFKREAKELALLGIPVDAFYMESKWGLDCVQPDFEYIARETGGTAALLEDASQLIDVVCQSALDDIGGMELVMEYKARYSPQG